jgi:hypothetical protein
LRRIPLLRRTCLPHQLRERQHLRHRILLLGGGLVRSPQNGGSNVQSGGRPGLHQRRMPRMPERQLRRRRLLR